MKEKIGVISIVLLILLCTCASIASAAGIEKATVAVLPVLNDAGERAAKAKIGQGTQMALATWLTGKGFTVVAADKVAAWFTQNKIDPQDKEARSIETLAALGKDLGCGFVVSSYLTSYIPEEGGHIVCNVSAYVKVLDVAAAGYRANGIFTGYSKTGGFMSRKKREAQDKATALGELVAAAMEAAEKTESIAQAETVMEAAAPTTPAADANAATVPTDPKLVVILPTVNATGKAGKEETELTEYATKIMSQSFTDCGFTLVPAADVDKYIADNNINLSDDETSNRKGLAAIGGAFHAAYVVSGVLQPLDNTVGMTFVWTKKRARATMQVRVVDVGKADYLVDKKTTESADSSVIQGGAFEKRAGLRATAVRRAAQVSLAEFLKPFKPGKK